MPTEHRLRATPETVAWGHFDATIAPVLHVASGDVVTLDALPAALPEDLPADETLVLPGHRATMQALAAARWGTTHMITGPIHVEGAEPGDVLQVDVLEVRPIQRWGVTKIVPLGGTLPEDFPVLERFHSTVDVDAGTVILPWGRTLPLDPFFGILAVAPPRAWGRVHAMAPRVFGGNMDNKELRAGTTLYLPVFEPRALFSAADGHACQGDGEVCISAVETALQGRFRLTVRKDMALQRPFAETPTHLIAMGFDEDLDDDAKTAVREMIRLVVARTPLTPSEAYVLCSVACDFRVTQLVDGHKGVHGLLAKALL